MDENESWVSEPKSLPDAEERTIILWAEIQTIKVQLEGSDHPIKMLNPEHVRWRRSAISALKEKYIRYRKTKHWISKHETTEKISQLIKSAQELVNLVPMYVTVDSDVAKAARALAGKLKELSDPTK